MEKTRTMRRANEDDAPKVASLINTSRPPSEIPIARRRTLAKDVRRMQQKGHFLLVDDIDGSPAGAIYVSIRGLSGHLDLLSVAVSMTDSGLEQRLLTIAEMMCKAHGCQDLEIRVSKSHSSLVFYELGYRFSRADPQNAEIITMVKEFAETLH